MMYQAMKRYRERFGDRFPTIPLARARTEEEVVAIINEYLEKGKDVHELGYVKYDDHIQY